MIEVEFRLLGPFEVRRGTNTVSAGGGKRRALLAVLLLAANRLVTIDRLIDAVWGENPPKTVMNLVQGYVSDWRNMLEPGRKQRARGERLVSSAGGYRLVVAGGECDLLRFEALSRDGQRLRVAGDIDRAAQLLGRALAEWRGSALADFAGEPFHSAAAAALEEARLEAVEAMAGLELELGRPDRALGRLGEAITLHPLRERLTELRMLALYRSGRQADALATYEAARRGLADALGVDPGVSLQQLHVQMLRQDPSLSGPPPAPVYPRVTSVLPLPLSSFVGRRRELKAVLGLMQEHRLVTLTGPGGSGKTRLALRTAAEVAEEGDREVAFVDLAPVRAADLVCPAIADALSLRLSADLPPVPSLARQLAGRRMMLVLDNLEQVLEASADVAAVLAAAPQLTVLATSREPLGIAGEVLCSVPPLPLPAPGNNDLTRVREADAVRLFLDRAAAAAPALTVGDEDAAVVAGICRRLDGLPLALELAAPWVRTLSLRALLEQLDHALGLLTIGGRDRPERQRTLRAAIDWSYQALPTTQRTLFDRLSVFRSGARFDAVAAVADLNTDCLPALRSLVDKNLVNRTNGDQPRYRLLETLREYAAECLAARPDDELAARDRHAYHFRRLAERAARASRTADGERHIRGLSEEQDEIRGALEHLHDTGRHDAALALAVDALDLWFDLGHIREGYERLRRALDVTVHDGTSLRAAAATGAAYLAEALGMHAAALELARSATELAHQAGDPSVESAALYCVGDLLSWSRPEEGRRVLEETIAIARSSTLQTPRWGWARPPTVLAGATYSLAESLRFRNPDRARVLLLDGLTRLERAGDQHTAAFLQRSLGFLAIDRGDWSAAESWLATSLHGARHAGSQRSEGRSHEALADLGWARGDLATAAEHARRAVQLSRDAGHLYNWARGAARLAEVLLEANRLDEAEVVLTDAAEALSPRDPNTANKLLAPARARAARLRGSTEQATAHLTAAGAAQPKDELRPERVTYLLESALLAATRGDDTTAVKQATDLDRQARQIGIVLAAPDRQRLHDLLDPQRSSRQPRRS
jgi:predicted ATPase/DNA-binding SARP family transcriptional activator